MSKYCYIIVFVSSLNFVFAQNLRNEFVEINKSYASFNKKKMIVTTNIYSSGKTNETSKYSYYKWNENSLVLTDEIEQLRNSTYVVNINKKDKNIEYYFVDDEVKQKKGEQVYDMLKFINNSFDKFDSIVYFGLNEGIKNYRIYTSKFEPMYIDIQFNEKTYFIKKITYYFDKDHSNSYVNKIIINYEHFDLLQFDSNLFSEKKYLLFNGKKIILSPSYSGYSLSHKNYLGE